MDDILRSLSGTQFNIFLCRTAAVGNAALHKDVEHDWFSSPEKPFFEHNLCRLYCVLEGGAVYYDNGKRMELKEGHTYFLKEGAIERSFCEDYMKQFYIHFSQTSFLPNITDIYEFEWETETTGLIREMFSVIEARYRSNEVADRLACSGAMLYLLSLFIKGPNDNATELRRLLPVLNYIDKNFTKNICVDELAGIMGYSTLYFEGLFKRILKIPPMRYVIKKRIQLAQSMLISEPMSVKEISEKCGYDDPLYFSRVFKKQTGFSPLEFKNRKYH